MHSLDISTCTNKSIYWFIKSSFSLNKASFGGIFFYFKFKIWMTCPSNMSFTLSYKSFQQGIYFFLHVLALSQVAFNAIFFPPLTCLFSEFKFKKCIYWHICQNLLIPHPITFGQVAFCHWPNLCPTFLYFGFVSISTFYK